MTLDSLGDRMKKYEMPHRLPENLPIMLRLDGRAFHSFTRKFKKPFDDAFMEMMNEVAISLCGDIQNCKLAYVQSDEISILIHQKQTDTDAPQAWFDNQIQKICSVSASRAGSVATRWAIGYGLPDKSPIMFDARCFVLPEHEVINYFIWRQQDWERNSLQMYCRSLYSQKEMHGKNMEAMHDLLHDKGINWNGLPTRFKRGRCIVKDKKKVHIQNPKFDGEVERSLWVVDNEIPIFTEDAGRKYIQKRLADANR